MDSIPCEACGCTEYTQRSGFYICNNCDMQSQNIEDTHFEEGNLRRVFDDAEEREEIRSEKSITERKLTSWECYNSLLIGLVDELIDLGASKKIRVLTFQLWACYLQWSNVAFTSKTDDKVPALSLGFKNNDAFALYGIPKLKPKLFKTSNVRKKHYKRRKTDDSASESVSVASSRSIKLKQRKKAMNETMNKSDYEKPDFETLESLEKERESQRILKQNIVFKSSARAMLEEIVGPNHEPVEDVVTLKKRMVERRRKVQNLIYNRKRKVSSQRGPNSALTSITLIAIIRVALQLVDDEISLADILRWICEGRLSVNQPEKFVPSFSAYVKKYDLINAQRKGFQMEIRNLTCNLNLPDLPTPNLYKLAERYCTELCVPDDLLKLVLKLMVDSNVKMDYKNFQFRVFPDYECRVMAFILFVFKLLFSLDDFTEFQQSAFADAVNESQQSQSKYEIPKLFSWNSWKKFVECRKSVMSSFSASISELARYDQYRDENVFCNHWEKVKPTVETTREKINEALVISLRQQIASLSADMAGSDGKEFVTSPASLTPWSTLTEHILKNYSSSLPIRTREILTENFKTHSIKHTMDFDWCCDIAESLKMEVELCNIDDRLDVQMYDKSCNLFPTIGRLNRSVPVLLHDKEPPAKRRTENKLFPFKGSIYEHDSESAGQHQPNDVKICKASAYWCFDERSSAIEDFEAVVKRKFPRSFLWLLCECATILRCDAKDIYSELILVETVMQRLHGKQVIKKTSLGIRCRMDEW